MLSAQQLFLYKMLVKNIIFIAFWLIYHYNKHKLLVVFLFYRKDFPWKHELL